jgi:hypothetical protein
MLNRGEMAANMSFTFEEVGFDSTVAAVYDVWAGGVPVATTERFGFPVGPHAAEVFVVAEKKIRQSTGV